VPLEADELGLSIFPTAEARFGIDWLLLELTSRASRFFQLGS
jgi:hypothetical protein